MPRKSTTALLARTHIPRSAPVTPLDAYGRILDLADAVRGLRVAAESQTHCLVLPGEAVVALIDAHQALMTAHRILEASLTLAALREPLTRR